MTYKLPSTSGQTEQSRWVLFRHPAYFLLGKPLGAQRNEEVTKAIGR